MPRITHPHRVSRLSLGEGFGNKLRTVIFLLLFYYYHFFQLIASRNDHNLLACQLSVCIDFRCPLRQGLKSPFK